jgi:hypothetical protein
VRQRANPSRLDNRDPKLRPVLCLKQESRCRKEPLVAVGLLGFYCERSKKDVRGLDVRELGLWCQGLLLHDAAGLIRGGLAVMNGSQQSWLECLVVVGAC